MASVCEGIKVEGGEVPEVKEIIMQSGVLLHDKLQQAACQHKSNCSCLCTHVILKYLLSPTAGYTLIGKETWCLVVPAIVMSKVSKLGLSKSRVEL